MVADTVDEYDRDADGVILVDFVSLAVRDPDAEEDGVCDTDPVKDLEPERVKEALRVADNDTLEERLIEREAEFEPVSLGVCDHEADDERVCDTEPLIDLELERLSEALRVLDPATLAVRLNERDAEMDAVSLGVCDQDADEERVRLMELVKDFVSERVNDALTDTLRVCVTEVVYDLEIDALTEGDRVCDKELLYDLEPEGVKATVPETDAETLSDPVNVLEPVTLAEELLVCDAEPL